LAAAIVYGAGLLVSIGASAAYHLIAERRAREIARRCDRMAIYLLIAGTYTPFALVALGDRAGLGLLGTVWMVALAGSVLAWLRPRQFERTGIVLYLALGWIGLPLLDRLIAAVPAATVWLLAAGGMLYTAGVGFHLWHRLPGHNAVWHGFVLAAAACHYFAVLNTLAA
tara:strand:- start:152 stop:658 length:507 start_codon:yes stop_codon:yes gene_type:complete